MLHAPAQMIAHGTVFIHANNHCRRSRVALPLDVLQLSALSPRRCSGADHQCERRATTACTAWYYPTAGAGGSGDSWLVGPEGRESVSALRGLPPASGSPSLRGRAKFLYPALSRVNLENVERTPRPQSTWKEEVGGEGNKASH